jgi:ABC-type uncharacterized transport system YnjBCD permease subunit
MELLLCLIITIAIYILLAYILYNAWTTIFEEASETVTKGMKVVCIILGLLWPITLLILIPATFIVIVNNLKKL